MNLNTHSRCTLLAIALTAALLSATAAIGQITPLEQDRSVSGFVIVPQCAAKHAAFDEARSFEFFKSTATASADCALAGALASSTQASSIGAAHLTAMSSSTSDASAAEMNVIHAIADSLYEVTFEVDALVHYTLSGIITAQISNSNVIFAGTLVTLRDADDTLILEHSIEGDPNGEQQIEALADEGVLLSGVYTFRAMTFTGVDNDVPPSILANAYLELDMQLAIACVADLNDDGHVGPEDLAILLGHWGPIDCAGPGCPDFNQDGEVNAADLATLLGLWGACP